MDRAARAQKLFDKSYFAAAIDEALLASQEPNADKTEMTLLVAKAMESGGPESAYKEFKLLINSSKAYFGEWEINQVGYLFLGNGNAEEAITAFSYNVEQYPSSANAYDSLAEAYYRAGDREMAKQHYQRSLELNPQNSNARQMLEQLR